MRKQTEVDNSKDRRIIVACTIGAVLLLVILLAVMVYQLITINHHQKLKNEYEAKIAEYEQLVKDGNDSLEVRQMRWWIERRAYELGYVYTTDDILD